MPGVLRKAGLRVVEIPGWQTRGHGDVGKIELIIEHHTAEKIDSDTKPVLTLLTEGRPGSPGVKPLMGPLCQLALGQDGIFYVIAAGLAYHAGAGSWKGITAGNQSSIGIEAENNGLGEPWPEIQIDAMARGSAALAVYCGLSSDRVIGHKEWAPTRKIDPNFDMVPFRDRVFKYMVKPAVISAAPAPPAPTPVAVKPVDLVDELRALSRIAALAADEIEVLRAKIPK